MGFSVDCKLICWNEAVGYFPFFFASHFWMQLLAFSFPFAMCAPFKPQISLREQRERSICDEYVWCVSMMFYWLILKRFFCLYLNFIFNFDLVSHTRADHQGHFNWNSNINSIDIWMICIFNAIILWFGFLFMSVLRFLSGNFPIVFEFILFMKCKTATDSALPIWFISSGFYWVSCFLNSTSSFN